MNENTVNLGIDSTLKEYHKGDHIFAVDFGKNVNDDKPSFQIHEYEIKSVINSHFENATGLPHPDHRMSMEDLAILARHIIRCDG